MTLRGPGPPHGREPCEPRPSLGATAREYAGLRRTSARPPTRSSGRYARQRGSRAAALPLSSATRRPPPSCLLPTVSRLRRGSAASRLEPPADDASHPRSAHRGPRQGAAQDLHPWDDHDRSRRPAPRRAMTGGGRGRRRVRDPRGVRDVPGRSSHRQHTAPPRGRAAGPLVPPPEQHRPSPDPPHGLGPVGRARTRGTLQPRAARPGAAPTSRESRRPGAAVQRRAPPHRPARSSQEEVFR